MTTEKSESWHAKKPERCLEQLTCNPDAGLSSEEVQRRLTEYGANRLAEKAPRPAWLKFVDQFKSLLVLILIGAAVLAGAIGDIKDAVVIGIVVLLNATLGFLQEHRAEAALAALKNMLAPGARVRRDGEVQQIEAADLVAHRKAFWHPARAKVIVSGGIAPDEASALVKRMLGGWTADAPPAPVVSNPDGASILPRTVVIDMPDAGQAAVLAGVRAIPRSDDRYYDLMLADAVLGGGSSGRLFDEVRTKRALSYGAYSGFASRAGESVLSASAQTKNETAAEVAEIFLKEFGRLGSEPLPEELLQKRRLYLGGAYSRALETSSGFNSIVAGLMLQGIEPAEAARLAERLDAVSSEGASAVAAELVDPAKATVIIVGDAKQFIDKLRAIRPDVEVIPVADLDLSTPALVAPAGEGG